MLTNSLEIFGPLCYSPVLLTCKPLKLLLEICLQNVSQLSTYGLIQTDEDGYVLRPLEPGRFMAKYYLCFETMKLIVQARSGSTLEDLLHILSQAQELKWIKLRRTEKKLLNDINSDVSGRLRFHVVSPNGKVKRRIQTAEEKIFILTNDALSGESSALDFTMSQDVNGICSNGKRIARCISDYFIFKKRILESINGLTLSKCLHQRLWEDSPYQLKQLAGVGMVTAKALLHGGINSFDKLLSADPRRLEGLTGRKYPFGNHVKESLDSLPPHVSMKFLPESCSKQGITYTLQLTRTCPTRQNKKKHFADLVVGTESDNKLLFHEKIRLDQFSSPYQVTIRSPTITHSEDLFAALISEEYVGVDVTARFVGSCGEKKNKAWSKRNLECAEGKESSETKESDFVGDCVILTDSKFSPLAQEMLVAQNSRLSTQEMPSTSKPPIEAFAAESFSGPTFSLLPDSHQQPAGKRVLEGSISEQDDSQPQSRGGTKEKRVKVAKLNVFDHIKKKAKKLPLSGLLGSNTSPYSDASKRSANLDATETVQKDHCAKFRSCRAESEFQDYIQETMMNNLPQPLVKEKPQSTFKVVCNDKTSDLRQNVAPSKEVFPPAFTTLKQSSPVSVQNIFGDQDSKRHSFMDCSSIFSFL